MEWPEWIDAMHKLGYSDGQIAEMLKEKGYEKKAIKKAFEEEGKVPLFHTLIITDPDSYFDRLDTSETKTPLLLLSVNAVLAGVFASLAFDVSLPLSLIASIAAAAAQVFSAHAGARLFGGEGTPQQTLFAQAMAVSTQFFLASLAFLFFAFFKLFSSAFAFVLLILMLWVAMMLSGAVGYPGIQRYHDIGFPQALLSSMMLPFLAIAVGLSVILFFSAFRFLSSL